MEVKDSYKILVVTDTHDDIEKVKKLVNKVKDIKFDYVFCCGDVVSVPIDKNDDNEITKEYIIKLKNIFEELEKLGPILWVPGNHEPGIYFTNPEEPVTKNSENLHKKIKKLVITVPAYFEDQQKKITEQAATALGLKVIKIIPEPTAAALAYGFNKENIKDEKILVFDLGVNTFDISILSFESEKDKDKDCKEIEIKNLKVLAIDSDMHLGRKDFYNALVDFVKKKKNKEVQNEIEKDPQKRKKYESIEKKHLK